MFRSDDWYSFIVKHSLAHTRMHSQTIQTLTYFMSEKWFCSSDTYPRSTTSSSNLVFVNMQSSHIHSYYLTPSHPHIENANLKSLFNLMRYKYIWNDKSRLMTIEKINRKFGENSLPAKKHIIYVWFMFAAAVNVNKVKPHKFLLYRHK